MLTRWNPLPISLIGRINVLKMSVMPKLLYFFETLPIPMTQLKLLKRWLLNFIWRDGAHRVASSVIFSPRSRGGLGASDIRKYYLVSHLRAVVSWHSLMRIRIGGRRLRWALCFRLIPAPLYGRLHYFRTPNSIVSVWALCCFHRGYGAHVTPNSPSRPRAPLSLM